MSEQSWHTTTIADCLTHAFAGEWGGEPTPANAVVLRATDIGNDGHITGQGALRAISPSKLNAKRLQDGDILLEGSGGSPDNPVGRVALFEAGSQDQPALCSNFFKTLRPNREIVDVRFLWRKLCWFYRQPQLLSMQQQTTGIINLKFQDYLAARISLPLERDEQSKVAEILDTLDTAIRQTEAIIAKLKQVKQGLLHDLLTRGIDANGELRPPQSEAPHLYKASPLGWIPVEWEVAPLLSKIDLPQGQVDPRIAPYPDWTLIAPDHIESATGRLLSCVSAKEQSAISGKYLCAPGDVIYSKIRPYLRKATVAKAHVLCSADMYPFTPHSDVHSEFLLNQLLGERFSRFAESVSMRTGMPKINREELSECSLAWPNIEEQSAILEVLGAIDRKQNLAIIERDKGLALKCGLMDDLLTGRVRVTPLLAQAHATQP